jgi:hypothetical protein
MGMLCAFGLVLSGRPDDARPWAEKSVRAARVLEARPTEVAALALLAEITGDASALPAAPAVASSVAEALVLRAHAASGDASARQSLQQASQLLVAPGLLIGI